jgi:hypothetical protein
MLLTDANELSKGLKSDGDVRRVFVQNDKICAEITDEASREAQIKFLNRLIRIVEAIPFADTEYTYRSKIMLLSKCFIDKKLYLESDLIGFSQDTANSMLVCDDAFISNVAISEGLKLVGMNRFLCLLDLDIKDHFEKIK